MSIDLEASSTPEEIATPRILEIGFGDKPAYRAGGDLFRGQVDYVGVDLPPTYDSDLENHRSDLRVAGVMANVASLPFANDSFDVALMRSVFGQPFATPEKLGEVYFDGLNEIYRVLKPDGRLVIAEENTPAIREILVEILKKTGFEITDQAVKQHDTIANFYERYEWQNLRQKYFSDRLTQPDDVSAKGFGFPYILIARPTHKTDK